MSELTQTPDGLRQICCVCCEWTDRDDLYIHPDDGMMDVCKPCAEDD